MRKITLLLSVLAGIAWGSGCSPIHEGAQLGVKVVGKVVNDAETQKLGQKLIGQPPAAADQLLGARTETLREVNGSRTWLVYPVKTDLLGSSRYVVAVSNNQIVAVQMVSKDSSDIARNLYYLAKVKGQTPAEAQNSLGLGAPLLVVENQDTKQVSQLYDASLIENLSGKVYCVLRFSGGTCTDVNMLKVDASTEK